MATFKSVESALESSIAELEAMMVDITHEIIAPSEYVNQHVQCDARLRREGLFRRIKEEMASKCSISTPTTGLKCTVPSIDLQKRFLHIAKISTCIRSIEQTFLMLDDAGVDKDTFIKAPRGNFRLQGAINSVHVNSIVLWNTRDAANGGRYHDMFRNDFNAYRFFNNESTQTLRHLRHKIAHNLHVPGQHGEEGKFDEFGNVLTPDRWSMYDPKRHWDIIHHVFPSFINELDEMLEYNLSKVADGLAYEIANWQTLETRRARIAQKREAIVADATAREKALKEGARLEAQWSQPCICPGWECECGPKAAMDAEDVPQDPWLTPSLTEDDSDLSTPSEDGSDSSQPSEKGKKARKLSRKMVSQMMGLLSAVSERVLIRRSKGRS